MTIPMAKTVTMGITGQGSVVDEGRQVAVASHKTVKVEDMISEELGKNIKKKREDRSFKVKKKKEKRRKAKFYTTLHNSIRSFQLALG
jgi:hypothetical protein